MKLRFSYLRPGADLVDLQVTADATVTVGDLAAAIERCDPQRAGRGLRATRDLTADGSLSLRVHQGGVHGPSTVLGSALPLGASGLRSGSVVSLAPLGQRFAGPGLASGAAAATLTVLTGPDTGASFPLREGSSLIGRDADCEVRLSDPLVSKRHARITITDTAEVVDLGSANGLLIGGTTVSRAVLRPQDRIIVGDTSVGITVHRSSSAALAATADVEVNRSPRLDPTFTGEVFQAPEPPDLSPAPRFPVIAMAAPLVMGMVMFAVTRSLLSVVFVALSPLLMIGSYVDGRVQVRRSRRSSDAAFAESVRMLRGELDGALAAEQVGRMAENPSTAQALDAVNRQTPLLWTRRAEHERFLTVRLGTGTQPSRHQLELPRRGRSQARHWAMLLGLNAAIATVPDVPVVADLDDCGSLGVAGSRASAPGVARALVAQLVALHSPADLAVACLTSSDTSADWEWLKWLPHNGSPHSPLRGAHLGLQAASGTRLIAEIEDLIAERLGQPDRKPGSRFLPALLIVVEDDAPVDRSRMVGVAESGAGCGVHVLWVSGSQERLPAACRTFLAVEPNGQVTAGFVRTAAGVTPIVCETVSQDAAMATARALAPLADVGARITDDSDLPRSLTLLNLLGPELASRSSAIVEKWRETESIVTRTGPPVKRRTTGLRAVVGQAADEVLTLDLRTQGPHALVGGTTGAGKSEFLQAWVLGMAAAYAPDTLTFLFVDYKGGAAFADCVNLPHAVGLVTDLSPHLVRRALTSLNAELRHREHILNAKKAKDLLELQRRGDPDCPPTLVIVVDEFAALVQEVPVFVDGVVNVAQRGRSLGLHLILATQRPAGVIKDNLRANTNLRVALRMADEGDSTDVLGIPDAASFPADIPGRGAVKTGPGRVTNFQTGYAGGWTSDQPPPVRIDLSELAFGPGKPWDEPESDAGMPAPELGPTDITRLVATIGLAAQVAEIPVPRKPWLPDMAADYDLQLLGQRRDSELVLGVVDDPAQQQQRTGYFVPDVDGNMAVFGTGGAGKSTVLRTLAIAAGITPRSGPCQVYGMDFGASGLRMLEALPHVGSIVSGDDDERIGRLVRWLKTLVDERAARYAAVRAGTITEYRTLSGNQQEPRLLLLVDGFAAFRQQYESTAISSVFTAFTQIASDGRPVGVHVVISADRGAAVPSSLRASIQRNLVLRLADPGDYGHLGVPADALSADSPPGRGLFGSLDIQVATFGGSPNLVLQARAVEKLADAIRSRNVTPAPEIRRLPSRVVLSDLPRGVSGVPVGVAGDTLSPKEIEPRGFWVLAGPPGSGTAEVLAGMADAVRRDRPGLPRLLVSAAKSTATQSLPWTAILRTTADVDEWTARVRDGAVVALFLENVSGLVDEPLESDVLTLVQAIGRNEGVVFAESETERWRAYSDLLKLLRGQRRGMLVEPDSGDGEMLLSTELPRGRRRDFARCSGMLVADGSATKVQFVEVG